MASDEKDPKDVEKPTEAEAKPAPSEEAAAKPVASGGGSGNGKLIGVLGAVALFAIIVVVVLVAQGGGDGGDAGDAGTDTSVKPVVEVPEGEPPAEIEINDIVEGDGAEAKAGDALSMQYVGVAYSTGEEFDSSWSTGQPFSFTLGAGEVIPGWDEGIEGMKVGGRRELIIPSELAYGEAGSPPAIGPDETLIFVVDLLDVQPGAAAGAGAVPGG